MTFNITVTDLDGLFILHDSQIETMPEPYELTVIESFMRPVTGIVPFRKNVVSKDFKPLDQWKLSRIPNSQLNFEQQIMLSLSTSPSRQTDLLIIVSQYPKKLYKDIGINTQFMVFKTLGQAIDEATVQIERHAPKVPKIRGISAGGNLTSDIENLIHKYKARGTTACFKYKRL